MSIYFFVLCCFLFSFSKFSAYFYVFVIAHTLKPSFSSANCIIARMAASTSDTVPVKISVPLTRSTKPSVTPALLIPTSAAMIVLSAGDMVTMPIAPCALAPCAVAPAGLEADFLVKRRVRIGDNMRQRDLLARHKLLYDPHFFFRMLMKIHAHPPLFPTNPRRFCRPYPPIWQRRPVCSTTAFSRSICAASGGLISPSKYSRPSAAYFPLP